MPCQLPTCEFSIYDEDALDLAIFISPQYKDDVDILGSVYTYIDAVYDDIGWNVGIVLVDDSWNRYDAINTEIKRLYNTNPIKACLMVGEDMSENLNVFHASSNRKCEQAIMQWSTFDEYSTSPTCSQQLGVSPIHIDIPISLIYPNAYDTYNTKKNQLVSVFTKFSENREKIYTNNIIGICDEVANQHISLENELQTVGNASVYVYPTQNEVDTYATGSYKMFAAAAHANPLCILVNPHEHACFTTDDHAKNINTPFLFVSGCNTQSWWTEIDDDCLYQKQTPYGYTWFGHLIIDNENLRVMIAGLPIGAYIGGCYGSSPYGFICSKCLERMNNGLTIAESMIGICSNGSDVTMFGDPTFHY